MKDRSKVQRNLLMGLFGQAVALLLGVLLPKQILNHYGSEINGLLSSVTNIYAYIAIVEAGVAAASCQALYMPIAEKKYAQANAVIAACQQNYRKVGSIYIGLVCLFSFLYPLVIDTTVSYWSVFLIVLFNGVGNAVNFFFHGKYLILMKADGKQYIRSGLETVSLVVKQVGKIVLINAGFDVVIVQIAVMVASVCEMLWITRYVKKNYTWVDLKAKPDFSSVVQSKYVLAHEVNCLITLNLDTMVLTLFCDLTVVSVYALYSMLYGIISRVLHTIRTSLEFKIAYEYHRDRKRFLELFESYEICYIALAAVLISIVNYFILPFLTQYTAGVEDANYIDAVLPILFALVYLFSAGRYPSDSMIQISGHFQQTKNSAVLETTLNIVISVILVQCLGIAGALIGTIVSSLYRMIYLIEYVNKKIILRSTWKTYICWMINLLLMFGSGVLAKSIPVQLDSYGSIFSFCIPFSIVTFIVFFGVNFACMPQSAKCVWGLVRRILHGK